MAPGIEWRTISDRTSEVRGQIRGVNRAALEALLDIVRTDIMRRMHTPGSGRIYISHGHVHQASAPGQPPAADTGDLISSIHTETEITATGAIGSIGSDREYAVHLELGTATIAARPAWIPALKAATDKAQQIIREKYGKLD